MSKNAAFGTALNIGTAQVETATVLGTVTGSGNATIVTTASGMTGSPITTSVAVLENDTADTVAGKIRAALLLVANIVAFFDVSGSGAQVVLRRKAAAANDATMNISIDNGTCTGLTTAGTSTNTTAGVAYAAMAQVDNFDGPDLSLDTEDVTTHDSTGGFEEAIATLLRTGELPMDLVYDPNHATHDASTGLVARMENKILSKCQLVFPVTPSVTWTFDALVTKFKPSAPKDGALTASAALKIIGYPTLV